MARLMNIRNALKTVATLAITVGADASFAHGGHAMAGTHWHASDVWGFVAMAGVLAVAIWLYNGDK